MKINIFSIICLVLVTFAACKKDPVVVVTPPDTMLSVTFTGQKSGNFTGKNGYSTTGKVELGINEKSESIVRLNSNFQTMIATGSVAIYLSKNIDLKLSDASSAIKLADISQNGAYDFKLATAPDASFKYVIAWCAPAGIQFGNAELK
jgi:hypothetical protein